MFLENNLLIALILLFSVYLMYDYLLIDKIKGNTIAKIELITTNRIDSFIFIILLAIILFQNIAHQGLNLSSYLLISLIIVSSYTFFIRTPKVIFKAIGFYFANIFIEYSRLSEIKLTEDGTLQIKLEQRSIAIKVKNINELEKIYYIMRQAYLSN